MKNKLLMATAAIAALMNHISGKVGNHLIRFNINGIVNSIDIIGADIAVAAIMLLDDMGTITIHEFNKDTGSISITFNKEIYVEQVKEGAEIAKKRKPCLH